MTDRQERSLRQHEIYATAMQYLAGALPPLAVSALGAGPGNGNGRPVPTPPPFGAPLLYGPNNTPLMPDPSYSLRKSAAKRTGSMKSWIPQRLLSRQMEAYEREEITKRSTDLINNDPHAAGIADMFATTVIGPGLTPQPLLDAAATGMPDNDARRALQAQERTAYAAWYPTADAGQRMTFGAIQFLVQRNLVQYGEYLVLVHMLPDPLRPYSLALRVINPLRLKTPLDMLYGPNSNAGGLNIHDGIELDDNGAPVAYWIKKSRPWALAGILPDISSNFLRITARTAHRWNVLHGFICQEAEQIRGIPLFTPVMKMARDLSDYLDAELVSNVVTAALAYFIEVTAGTDPLQIARNMTWLTDNTTNADGAATQTRYETIDPGQVMYGNPGEKPNLLSADRPGQTFEPFTRIIKTAMAVGIGVPYAIAFKDLNGISFAGFRGAMLEAWRVFSHRRQWLGEGFCQKPYTMVMEEAWLAGRITVKNFYSNMPGLTRAEWRGYPKGDIEPVKAAQADIMQIDYNLKTMDRSIAENGGELLTTLDQREEEQEMMAERKLVFAKTPPTTALGSGVDESAAGTAPGGDGSQPADGGNQ